MNSFDKPESYDLNELARQVRLGVWGAAERFLEEMHPQMERMARRTIRRGIGNTAKEQSILRHYRQVCDDHPDVSYQSPDEIVSLVAWRVCESMVQEMQAMSKRQAALETVCA